MSVVLTCAALSAYVPALTLGVSIAYDRPSNSFHVPATRTVLRHIGSAIADGALAGDPPPDAIYDEIERQITLDRDVLLARAEALVLEYRALRAG